jgi:replicative DNA helicase
MAIEPQPVATISAIDPVALPSNLEAEQALIGALLIDNRLAEDIQLFLKPAHFYENLHSRVYEAILKTIDRGLLATPVTLKPLFEKDPAMIQMGGWAYLAQLSANTPALIGARDFARQIYDLALLRELVRVGRGMVEQAMEPSIDIEPQALIQDAEIALYKVAEQGEVAGSVKDFADAAASAVAAIDKAVKAGGRLSGTTTGLNGFDDRMGGLNRSDLIILAGRPGMGKTALATNIAFSAAERLKMDREDGLPEDQSTGAAVVFFSLEMSADQLAARILAEQSGISSDAMRKGRLTTEQFREISRAARKLESLPLYIDDTPGLTIAALRTRARRLKRQKKIGFIVVDYLQLLTGSGRNGQENRVQELSEITRGLKTLAKELDVPVMALSQLSRAVESREDKRPQLSDLRESGSIEQDADIVMFVFREEYYHAQKMPEEGTDAFEKWKAKGERIRGHAEAMIAKQRHGATGTVPLHFDKATTKFTDRIADAYAPELRG